MKTPKRQCRYMYKCQLCGAVYASQVIVGAPGMEENMRAMVRGDSPAYLQGIHPCNGDDDRTRLGVGVFAGIEEEAKS